MFVHLLILVDGLQVVVELVRAAGHVEVGLGVVGQALLVELALEVLEGQRVVEDGDIASWRRVEVGALLQRCG